MPYSPVILANTFVRRHGSSGEIDHLKLQKLVYFAQGWWLALNANQQSIVSARPQVWRFGPVFQPIYSQFAHFGNEPITVVPRTPWGEAKSLPNDSGKASEHLDWIWNKYGQLTGTYLSDLTHKQDTPWYKIASERKFVVPKFLEIPEDEDRAYFNRLAREEGLIA